MREITQIHQSQGVAVERLCQALLLSRATVYRHNKTPAANAPASNSLSCAPANALNCKASDLI